MKIYLSLLQKLYCSFENELWLSNLSHRIHGQKTDFSDAGDRFVGATLQEHIAWGLVAWGLVGMQRHRTFLQILGSTCSSDGCTRFLHKEYHVSREILKDIPVYSISAARGFVHSVQF
jgi:hypothetical protein